MFGSRNFLFAKSGGGANNPLFTWGKNASGPLGIGDTANRSSPVQVGFGWETPSGSRQESNAFCLSTKADGTLWAWGRNNFGQLAQGNTTSRSSPVQIGSLTTWLTPTAGGYFSLCKKTDGTLWVWGDNRDGSLGLNNTTNYSSPKQIGALTTWTTISAGYTFVLAVDNGKLFAWGRNNAGQLGLVDIVDRSSPVQVGVLTNWATPATGQNLFDPFSLCTKTDGTLWSWGSGVQGKSGQGNTTNSSSPVQLGSLTNWAAPAGGGNFSLCAKTDGTLWAWGGNGEGNLGIENTTGYSSPKQVGILTNWAIPSAGQYTSLCKKTDGTLWVWGRSSYGNLGLGNTTGYSSPVQVGSLNTWGKVNAGGAFCVGTQVTVSPISLTVPVVTGTTTEGQTLSSTTGTWSNDPAGFAYQWQRGTSNIGGATSSTYLIVAADVGSTLRCIVTATNGIGAASANSANTATVIAYVGKLFSWGANNRAQLGQTNKNVPRSSPVQVGAITTWVTPTAAKDFSFCTRLDGTLWSWGYNNDGRLGLNNTTYEFSSPVQIGALTTWQLAGCGDDFGNAVKTDGKLWSWGVNAYGQLGLNDTISSSSPVQIGSLTDWATPARGRGKHSLCVKTDGTLWAWGLNANGQCGDSTSTRRSSPVQVGLLTNWSIAVTGRQNSLCVKTDGTLWSWGIGSNGRLGLNNTTQYNSPKQIGTNTNWATPTNGFSSYGNSACTTTDGKLFTWGSNLNGQLGLGDTIDRSSPVQVGALTNWATPSMGYFSMGCRKTDGTLWMWGVGTGGTLGQNNQIDHSSPVQVGALTNWNTLSVGGGTVNNFVLCTQT